MQLTKGQDEALAMARKLASSALGRPCVGILAGYAGCHRKGQPILMFDGSIKAVEDIEVGEQLMGPDSRPRNVLALCRGRGRMVQVTPIKGEPFVVNEDHILTVDLVRPYSPQTVDVSIKEFQCWPKTKRAYSKLVRTGVNFEETDLPIHPYLLGALLGDGGLTHKTPDVTTVSSELLTKVSELIKKWQLSANPAKPQNNITYRLAGIKGKGNGLSRELKALQLLPIECERRFIPDIYKINNTQNRQLLLAGLMDTDGSVSCGGYEYTTKSAQLAQDVIFVARSLGLAAYDSITYKECQTGGGGFYHRIFISGDTSVLPCLVRPNKPRKQIKSVLHTGFSLKYLETEDYYGFTLDSDGRFLLGDFTVTHNTGKSTLLKFINEAVGQIQVITPTGKAALRVTEATGLPASTIHRWQYKPIPDPFTGGVNFQLKKLEEVAIPASRLVVIDEASMVGMEVWNDLYGMCSRLNLNILAVGDPFQLPPVEKNGKTGFSLLGANFHSYDFKVELTEVLRQALESPIIRASMEVRNGDALKAIMGLPMDSRVTDEAFVNKAIEILDSKGVIIVHQNKTRHLINNLIREKKGLFELVSNEPLLVLKNNYDVDLYNGEVVNFENWTWTDPKWFSIYDPFNQVSGKSRFGRAKVDGHPVALAVEGIKGRLDQLSFGAIEKVAKHACGKAFSLLHCNYGYCLTCHKSQGSEFPSVLVVIESSVSVNTKDGRRWVYTALTRSQKEIYLAWQPDFGVIK